MSERRQPRRRTFLSGIHFHIHDLRRTGNTFASQPGATPREPPNRMGHSTGRAAPTCPHIGNGRVQMIADDLNSIQA
ncbi:hypothetical protein [Streptosporangium sp. NPDC002524]|uniref:hypothetical protein n=1 Tax=Streptosporangium sp. NPDC002524 TaxID=3154537 RepID=UPI0033246350